MVAKFLFILITRFLLTSVMIGSTTFSLRNWGHKVFDSLFKPNVEKLTVKRNVEGLIKALRYQKDENVRRKAVMALGDMGDPRAVQPLIATLKDEDRGVCENVVTALGTIGDEQAIEPLIQLLADSDVELYKRVVSALENIIEKLKEKGDINRLIEILRNDDVELRRMATSALGKIFDRVGAVKALESIFKHVDYDKLKALGIQKTCGKRIPLVFKKTCDKCQNKSFHKYYTTQINFSNIDELVYSKEFKYIKCDNCEVVSNFFIRYITIDSRTKNKINFILHNDLTKLPEDATFIDLIELTKKIEESKLDKNLIDVIRRIKNQVIDGDTTMCYYCGNKVWLTAGHRCSVCNLIVCKEHRLPENHGCKGTKPNEPPGIRHIISRGETYYTSDPPGITDGF